MIQGITERTPDVEMSCPRAVDKVTSQACVVQNDRQTCGTATGITDACGGTCTDACGSMSIEKQTHGSMSKDTRGRACTYAQVSKCTDVSTQSKANIFDI